MSGNYVKAEVVEVPGEKKSVFKVMLGKHEIGESKTDFDARFHMHAINEALALAYCTGKDDLTESLKMVADIVNQKMCEERKVCVQTSGPQCKRCGNFTTMTRTKSLLGLCMRCEDIYYGRQ